MTEQTVHEPPSMPREPEWRFLTSAQNDQLAALLLELAGQLHVERVRVLTLEYLLAENGVIERAALERASTEQPVRARAGEELKQSLSDLLRVLTENDDARQPLRHDLHGEE